MFWENEFFVRDDQLLLLDCEMLQFSKVYNASAIIQVLKKLTTSLLKMLIRKFELRKIRQITFFQGKPHMTHFILT